MNTRSTPAPWACATRLTLAIWTGRTIQSAMLASGLMMVLSISGCAHGPTPNREAQRQQALDRWQLCLSRQFRARQADRPNTLSEAVIRDCEGHQRDVQATYPDHLAPQLDQLLRSHAQKALTQALLDNAAGTTRNVVLP